MEGAGGEDVQRGEERVEEAEFLMGDTGIDCGDEGDCSGKLEAGGTDGGCEEGGEEGEEGYGEEGGEEEGEGLG